MYKRYLLLFFVFVIMVMPLLENGSLSDHQTRNVRIEITGAVEDTAIFELPVGSTVGDALELVQLSDDADLSVINLNTVLKNNDVLVIPHRKVKELVSINHSDAQQLCQLKGIGPALAQRIIDYRTQHGLFRQLEEIMKVKGIGEKTFEKIREDICL